jgi:hypothetical protein
MGRRRLLTGVISTIPATSLFTFSWGPFNVPLRVISLRCRNGDQSAVRSTVGLFIAKDSGFVTGAAPTQIVAPPGWTALHEPSLHAPNNTDDRSALAVPFQTTAGEAIIADDIGVLIFDVPFWLKLLIWNPTAIGAGCLAHVVVEEAPDADPATGIEPRTQPTGAPQPATTPTTSAPPPPPPATTPAPPAPTSPPITTAPGSVPTMPPVAFMPPFAIDPTDPDESARQATS